MFPPATTNTRLTQYQDLDKQALAKHMAQPIAGSPHGIAADGAFFLGDEQERRWQALPLAAWLIARHAFAGGRIFRQQRRRPDRPRDEIAAAIGAHAAQRALCAVHAECAFKRADARLVMRGQIAVAAFTIGFEPQHGRILPGRRLDLQALPADENA
jgi:hypothetical protein